METGIPRNTDIQSQEKVRRQKEQKKSPSPFLVVLTLVLASQNHLNPEGNLPHMPAGMGKSARHRCQRGVL